MRLKNRTSSVPFERTLARIETLLVDGGATAVSREYDGRQIAAFFFSLPAAEGRTVNFRLPANVDAVYAVMASGVKRPRRGTLDRIRTQALRTAWKLMQDWVEVQMSLVAMDQAEAVQVFLPYAWNGKETLYAQLKAGNFQRLLGDGR